MERYKCDILGLAEVRWTGQGEINGGEVIWSGEDKEHARGVGFYLSKRARGAMIGYYPVSPRIMAARFRGSPFDIAVVQIYAPTADSTEEDIEHFYEQLEDTMAAIPRKDVKYIIGDWNAKVGVDNDGWEAVMGRYGYGERNTRGERLLQFAAEHQLFIGNTRFQQRPSRKWTWRAPSGLYFNMIDLILVEKRWKTSLRNCRTYQGADIASDHSLVIAKVQLRLKANGKHKRLTQYDIDSLDQQTIRDKFAENLTEILDHQDKPASVKTRAENLTSSIQKAMSGTIPLKQTARKPYITTQTLELADKKRALKMHRDESRQAKEEYKKACNEVRQAARRDKERWLEERCREIQQMAKEKRSKQTYKLIKQINKDWQPQQRAIKNKDGKLLYEEEEIRERWTEYCGELYQEKGTSSEAARQLEKIAPRQEESEDTLLKDEVKKALTNLKKHKSAGPDGIVADVLQAGGSRLEEELYEIMNKVWQEEGIPTEWARSTIVTIPKKGDRKECANYRTLSLMNHTCKALMSIIRDRLQACVEQHLAEEQAGFRKDRSTTQQILVLRLMAEKAWRKDTPIYNCFIDFQKAFDTIKHEIIWAVLESFGVNHKITRITRNIYGNSMAAVKIGQETGRWFRQEVGTRQGDPLSPLIFITYLERVMDMKQDERQGVCVNGELFDNLRFADDIDLLEHNCERLQRSLNSVAAAAEQMGLRINRAKTKVMVFSDKHPTGMLRLEEEEIEWVEQFVYLGSLITSDNDCSKEIRRRIALATGAMAGFNKIWRSKDIRMNVKAQILKTCVFSVLLYASETWTIKRTDQDRLLAFEMRCYRRLLNIRWQQRITNVEVRRRMNSTENIVQTVIRRKMEFFGHICRMGDGRMVKKMVFGEMGGKNRKGRPRREWLDDVMEWGNGNLATLSREARNREIWRRRVQRAVDTYGQCAHGA